MNLLMQSRNPAVLASATLLLLLAWGWSPGVAQQTQGQVTQRSPSAAATPAAPAWTLNCSSPSAGSGALECQMSQTILRQETGQILMVIAVRKSQDGSMGVNFVLPHGLYLPTGVSYQVDAGTRNTAVIYSSDQNGAYATITLAPELLKALKSGSVLNIGMETVSRKQLTISVSLTGFASSIDRLANLK